MNRQFLSEVIEALAKLDSLIIETEEGLFISGEPLMTCTNSARWIANELGGEVFGYFSEQNQGAQLGRNEGGHDFAVVHDWIVDVWAHKYFNHELTLDTNAIQYASVIRKLYGLKGYWQLVS